MSESVMARVANTINALPLPAGVKTSLRSTVFGRAVPYVGTSKIRYVEMSPERVVVEIINRRRTRNHIGGVHAAAMALLAETATGFVVGLNLDADSVPLIKSLHVDYKRRTKGNMRAEAWLSPEQIAQIQANSKGEVLVNCTVTDESDMSPIEVQMLWAWVPAKKKAN